MLPWGSEVWRYKCCYFLKALFSGDCSVLPFPYVFFLIPLRQISWLIRVFCGQNKLPYLQSLTIRLPCPRGRLNKYVLSVFSERCSFASSPCSVSHNTVWLWELIQCDSTTVIHLVKFSKLLNQQGTWFSGLKTGKRREEQETRWGETTARGHGLYSHCVCGKDTCFPQLQGEKAMAPTPVLLPGESQGWGSLMGCRPWGH